MSQYVDLSEKVTATYYDAQYEEWTQQTVTVADVLDSVCDDYTVLPSAQPEDYTELKREFLRMASYIDVLLECSDEQKETLIGFISRLSEYMPWTERD